MSYFVHHVPGRARFRVPGMPKTTTQREALVSGLRAIKGVERVEINPSAASVVVHYDRALAPLDRVVEVLRAHSEPPEVNRIPLETPVPAAARGRIGENVSRSVGEMVGQAMFATIVQRTLEYSLRTVLLGR
ncbi:HMA2 domain-containing protein [Cereibacter sphaeroides]|uniref:HMA2 domain-containing protein n=1 Tax=Cereibacter johrii TaxID=445629 RepID=UPI002286FAF3